jgi:hypothetical protein
MGYDSVLLCNITDVSVELAASTLRAAEEEWVCGINGFSYVEMAGYLMDIASQ